MSSSIKIAALHVANLTDARYFAACDVDWMGFCLDSGATPFLLPEKVKEIREWVEGPRIFGELGPQIAPEIEELARFCRLDGVVAGIFQDAEILSELGGMHAFKTLVVDASTDERELLYRCHEAAPFVEGFVLDLVRNNIPWDFVRSGAFPLLPALQQICSEQRVWLHADLPAFAVPEAMTLLKPYGLCVQGGSELRTGIKSFDELDEWFEALADLD